MQSFSDWELIVCDSYSDDGSWEFFQKYKNDERVKLFQVPRAGLYAGWNDCLQRAIGEFIYIAPSDDTMEETTLESLLLPLLQYPDIDIAACDHYRIDGKSERIPRGRRTSDILGKWARVSSIRSGHTEFILHMCCGSIWSTMNSIMFRRRLLRRVGYFPTVYGSSGDLSWTLRASLASDVAWIPRELAGFRIHGSQATPQKFAPFDHLRGRVVREDTLCNNDIGIPREWAQVAKWRSRLLACSMSRYVRSLELERGNFRGHPYRFLKNAAEAARNDPRWLFRWMRHGFRYTGADWVKPETQAHELIELFGAPWPPKRVEYER